MSWLPIETAPRRGEAVIVACYSKHTETWRVCEAQWLIPYEGCQERSGYWGLLADKTRCILDASVHKNGATHWMPLPEPPQ
jgi:hypothetical protein